MEIPAFPRFQVCLRGFPVEKGLRLTTKPQAGPPHVGRSVSTLESEGHLSAVDSQLRASPSDTGVGAEGVPVCPHTRTVCRDTAPSWAVVRRESPLVTLRLMALLREARARWFWF